MANKDADDLVAGILSGPMGPSMGGDDEESEEGSGETDLRMQGAKLLAGEMMDAVKSGNAEALARAILEIKDL